MYDESSCKLTMLKTDGLHLRSGCAVRLVSAWLLLSWLPAWFPACLLMTADNPRLSCNTSPVHQGLCCILDGKLLPP